MSQRLEDRRVLVVGASSGIGRATSLMLASEGARVAVAARREDRLAETVKEAGRGAIAVGCDVRDPEQCARCVALTVEQLGGLDGLVYATGVYPPSRLADTDAEAWRWILETNLVGASLVTRAALPHLEASSLGRAAYVSSISGSLTPPWLGLGPYGVSKAGLERLVDSWRGEHPSVGFTNVIVGNTTVNEARETEPGRAPESTTLSTPNDPGDVTRILERWTEKGYFSGEFMHVEGVAEQIVHVLASRERVWELTVLGEGWNLA